MSPRTSRIFEILLVTVLMVTYAYAASSEAHNFATEWFIRDDAFFYYKVAQNITEGRGSTLDGLNLTNGYHPLWMLINIPIFALARFDLILPLRILVLLSGLISAATGVLLFRLAGRLLSPPAAVLAAVYWCFDHSIHFSVTMFGLETGLTALTMTALLLAISRIEPDERHKPLTTRQLWTLGLLAVAMLLSRLDTIFVAGLAGAWILLRGTSIRSYLFLDLSVIILAAFTSIASRTGLPAYFVYVNSALALAALGTLIYLPAFYLFGLDHPFAAVEMPSLWRGGNVTLRFLLVSLACATIVVGGMIGLTWAGPLQGLPRSALPVFAGMVLLGTGAVRLAARTIASHRPAVAPLAEFRQHGRQWLREGAHYFGLLGGALALYMGINRLIFGTFMPVSGQIKQWWGSLQGSTYGNPIDTLTGFLGLEVQEGQNTWGPVIYQLHALQKWLGLNTWVALGVVGVVTLAIFAIRPQRAVRAGSGLALPLLFSGSVMHMFYYTGLGYAGAKDWYWVSQMLMFALFGALLVDLVSRPFRRIGVQGSWSHSALWAMTGVATLAFVIPFAVNLIQRMPHRDVPADKPYMDVLPFLESNTEPGALIGMTGGGNVGYFIHDRTIVNMDGLINSYQYSLALRAGRADEYLENLGLDYIFSNPDILLNPPYNGQFDEWSLLVAQFGKKDLLKYNP